MTHKKSPTIILLGRSGSGKGTQANLLCERLGLRYIGTGELLRKLGGEENFLGSKLKSVLARGDLAPTWLAFYVWLRELADISPSHGVVFDGSPRMLREAKFLDEVFDWYERKNIKVILIDISREEAFRRLTRRRICKECGTVISYEDVREPQSNDELKELKVCDRCGGGLETRPDDDPEAVQNRMDWFEKEVLPVVEHYRKKDMLTVVNGEQSVQVVFKEIIKVVTI